jgi:hypothetical protein
MLLVILESKDVNLCKKEKMVVAHIEVMAELCVQ